MPDSFGKRNREKIKARKAEARDDRRIARNQRRKGILPATPSNSAETIDQVVGDPIEPVAKPAGDDSQD